MGDKNFVVKCLWSSDGNWTENVKDADCSPLSVEFVKTKFIFTSS